MNARRIFRDIEQIDIVTPLVNDFHSDSQNKSYQLQQKLLKDMQQFFLRKVLLWLAQPYRLIRILKSSVSYLALA